MSDPKIDKKTNRIVREGGREYWDHDSAERFYLQDYIGKKISIFLQSREEPVTGELVEMGMFIYVIKAKDKTVIIPKHAIEMVVLP